MTDDRFKTGGALDALPDQAKSLEANLRGRHLSGYEVGGLVGAGGMGYVLRATRAEGDFERVAALKVVPTSLGTSELAQRFRTEVQILAKLNHPAIAQLYDAGETDEGWPYLLMEYVDGDPVDIYCRENDLSTNERVRILVDVCRAVRFAHARLVVHRDLKPSNVLVTSDRQTKLLDFGIAKLLEPGTDILTVAHRPMTPKYASPEQLLGSDITTGSDIYQLGILFLAVLGDETPFADTSLKDAIRRAAAGDDVEIPDKARRDLPDDLIAIITQCLHSDPEDRYPDLNALISDLENFLGGFPVDARRGSTLYRARKLVRRNLAATTIAAVATIAIVASTAYYTYNLAKARDVAERRAETSSRLLQAMSTMIADTYSELIESRSTLPDDTDDRQVQNEPLRVVLDRTQKLIDDVVTDNPAVRAELLLVQGVTNRELSRYDESLDQLEASLALSREADNIAGMVRALRNLAELQSSQAKHVAAQEQLNLALDLLERHDVAPRLRAEVYTAGINVHSELGNTSQALEFALKSIEILEALPEGPSIALADAYGETAGIYGRLEQRDELRSWSLKSIDLYTQLEGPLFRDLGPAYSSLAYSYAINGEYELAREYFSRELDVAQANFGVQHVRTAAGLINLGMTYRRLGDYDKAIDNMLRAEAVLENIGIDGSQQLPALYSNLGNTYRDTGELNKAAETYEKGLTLLGDASRNRRLWSFLMNNSGELMVVRGETNVGIERLQDALKQKTEVFGANNISTARTMLLLVHAELAAGEVIESPGLLDGAEAIYVNTYGPDHTKMSYVQLTRGMYLRSLGQLPEARTWLERAYENRLSEYHETHIDVAYVAVELAKTEMLAGNLDRARDWLEICLRSTSGLSVAQIERIETEIVAAELLLAEGKRTDAQERKRAVSSVLEAHYPARKDWQQRLEGI